MGSSPPVRGAHLAGSFQLKFAGLIPARAGSTRHTNTEIVAGRAHPRPCGEHARATAAKKGAQGSSPPVRGARGSDEYAYQ